jgi:hypothetical protein
VHGAAGNTNEWTTRMSTDQPPPQPPPQPPAQRPLPKFEGDALARLLQLEAWRCGIDDWRTNAKGVQDVALLMTRLYNAEMHVKHLKHALTHVHKEVQKCDNIEGVVTVMTLAILRAQSNYDLELRTGTLPT